MGFFFTLNPEYCVVFVSGVFLVMQILMVPCNHCRQRNWYGVSCSGVMLQLWLFILVCVCVCVCVGRFRNSRLRSPTAAEGPKHAGSLLGSQRTGLQHREGNMQNEVRMRSAVTGQRGKVKGHLGGLQKNTQKTRTHTHTHTHWWQRAP